MDYFWHDAIKEWRRTADRPKRCVCIIQDEKEHEAIRGAAGMFGMNAEKILDSPYIEHPTSHMILTGMYDDVISRALNRGIGIEKKCRPIHFGLLNNDCRWVTRMKSPALEGLKSMHRLGTYRSEAGSPVNAPVLSMKKLFDLDSDVDIDRYVTGTANYGKKYSPKGAGIWQSLKDHSVAVWKTALNMEIKSPIKETVCNAARMHDIGKAQPKFQNALLDGLPDGERERRRYTIWAKRPHMGTRIQDTRHDLSGGLSRARHSEVEAYLIVSHHGRYRTSIPDTTETIPKADLGHTVRTETYTFTSSHYTEMFDHIYTQYGPFILAYMEAIVRCADIISSREASESGGPASAGPLQGA